MTNYKSTSLALHADEVHDVLTGKIVRVAFNYWPKVDVTVQAGDGVQKGKQATMQALQTLAGASVTADNWKLYKAMLEILDIPQKQEIVEEWEQRFGSSVPPEVVQALEQDPQLLASVMQLLQQKSEPQTMMMGGGAYEPSGI